MGDQHHLTMQRLFLARAAATAHRSSRMQSTVVTVTEKAEGVLVIALDKPDTRNALSRQMLSELSDALEHARTSSPRVVIFESLVPKVFCAGADLKERKTMGPDEVADFVRNLRATFSAVENLPMPTIAAIEGAALGGGLELALACDMRVAGAASKLGLPETGLAIIPGAGGTQRLPRVVGLPKAKELVFTASILNSTDAQSIGLVNYAVDQGAALDKALELSALIVPRGPIAVRLAKLAMSRGMDVDRASGFAFEEACYAQVIPTEDRLEGLAAFAEKRKPVYKGK